MTEIENQTQSALRLGTLSLNEAFPQRPAFGTGGKPVTLWANYVHLAVDPKLVLYSYNISTEPSAAGKKLTQVIKLLLELPEFAEFRNHVVTDFKSNLVSRKRLRERNATEDAPGVIVYHVPYRAELQDEPKENAVTYKVILKFTHTLPVNSLIEYLTSSTLSSGQVDKQPTIQALNIFLNHYSKTVPGMGMIGSSRNFPLRRDYDGTGDLGYGLQVIRGFFASVRAATARILVNVNVSYGAFYKPGPLDVLISQFTTQNMVKLGKFLKGVPVTVTHLRPKKNKAGQEIPRKKVIIGLAIPRDGRDLAHPPKISGYGADSKNVQFWLEETTTTTTTTRKATKGSKGAKSTQPGGQPPSTPGKYISVYEFFKQSKLISPHHIIDT